jgi:hypothetical protein
MSDLSAYAAMVISHNQLMGGKQDSPSGAESRAPVRSIRATWRGPRRKTSYEDTTPVLQYVKGVIGYCDSADDQSQTRFQQSGVEPSSAVARNRGFPVMAHSFLAYLRWARKLSRGKLATRPMEHPRANLTPLADRGTSFADCLTIQVRGIGCQTTPYSGSFFPRIRT